MIGIGIFFSILGLGSLAWLLFSLYVYALPTIVGGIAGYAAYHSGAGGLGAVIVGFFIGVLTLVGGWTAIRTSRSPVIRIAVMLLFVVPAGWAGYSVTLDFARWLEVPSTVWQQVYALFGAFMVGGTALARLTDPNLFNSEEMMTWL
jgi:hypothetical protein